MASEDTNASEEVGLGMPERPPKDDLFRAVQAGVEVRESADSGGPVLYGHFARFNEWTKIESAYEGRFMERIAPGAFARTIEQSASQMRVLLNHGNDSLGQQVLGKIRSLREDSEGAAYEVDLFESVPPLVMEGLRKGAYGASFRFKVNRDSFDQRPPKSDYNPDGLPERTITEAQVREFGPVTFPAYEGATAGVRSLNDEMLVGRLGVERLEALLRFLKIDTVARPIVDPEPSEATTPQHDRDPEPSEATTRSHSRDLFWFVANPAHGGQ